MNQPTPYWSVMITSYNRPYIIEALRSVLAQDPGPEKMHIEVVDDHSTTLDIESLIHQQLPAAKNRVAFHRNPKNLGIYHNWNNCIERAKGQWVHILHDDDLIDPGFYRAMESAAAAEPAIAAAFCSTRLIDEQGHPLALPRLQRTQPGIYPDLLQRLLAGNAIQFASIVVRRDVYHQLGGFDANLDYVADWDMWMRIAARHPGGVWYEPQTLAAYRQHQRSETSALMRSGRERRGFTAAADRWLQYAGDTPQNRALQSRQKEIFATDGLHIAAASFTRGDLYAGIHQLKAALECSSAPSVFHQAQKFVPHLLAQIPPDSKIPYSGSPDSLHKILDFLAENTPP